jgi:hypothetical protein
MIKLGIITPREPLPWALFGCCFWTGFGYTAGRRAATGAAALEGDHLPQRCAEANQPPCRAAAPAPGCRDGPPADRGGGRVRCCDVCAYIVWDISGPDEGDLASTTPSAIDRMLCSAPPAAYSTRSQPGPRDRGPWGGPKRRCSAQRYLTWTAGPWGGAGHSGAVRRVIADCGPVNGRGPRVGCRSYVPEQSPQGATGCGLGWSIWTRADGAA